MELLDRVRGTIRRHALARPDTRVVVALSGGSDSVALACLLRELDVAGELSVAGVAHFNHQLRPSADDEEQLCREMAGTWAWPFLADREDVSTRARLERRSLEDAARTARHEFFTRARRHFDAEVVAVGHTRDDQAETFLLRLVRGASARGLAGMHPRRGHIVRPLLDCRRHELLEYLERRRMPYVHDASNDDLHIPRNRVRAELLPLIERRFNPSIVAVLAHEADLAREEWRWMETAADEAMPDVCRRDGSSWRIDAEALNRLPVALSRTVVRRAMMDRSGGRPVGFTHVEDVLQVAREGGGPVDLPRHRVERIGRDVVLSDRADRRAGRRPGGRGSADANLFRYPLSIPGEVGVSEAGWSVSAEAAPSLPDARSRAGLSSVATVAMVQRDPCGPGLAVRNWRPGDRFRPLGLGGHKKLQDFFVDRKVVRHERSAIPLVVDERDRIVWVAGHAISEDFRVTDPAQAVVILRLKLVGGPA